MGSVLKKQKLNKGTAKVEKVEKVDTVDKSDKSETDAVKSTTVKDSKVKAAEDTTQASPEEESEVEFEELDELDLDDEVDVDGVSSGSGSGSESESDYDEDIPKLKKKKNLDDGSKSFASAFSAIVNSKLKAYDRKDPILARSKVTLKKFEQDKLDAKAKRALRVDKKEVQDKHRVKQLMPSGTEPELVREMLQSEKDLKKIAQKGVVRLFNAVLSTQIKTTEALVGVKAGETRKDELMTEISKEKFLDLVQLAGK